MAEQHVEETCPADVFQNVSVCVPVEVMPFAEAGSITTFCCDDPILTPGTCHCPGKVNGKCQFTITQNICIKIPIEFGAETVVGNPFIVCGTPTTEDSCSECSSSSEDSCSECSSSSEDICSDCDSTDDDVCTDRRPLYEYIRREYTSTNRKHKSSSPDKKFEIWF